MRKPTNSITSPAKRLIEIRHGYLYLADLSPRRGTEPGKTRPVLVIQSDLLNAARHPSTWIVPCTTHLCGENLLRVFLPKSMAGNKSDCDVMIDQCRTIDNHRFKTRLGRLPDPILKEVKQKLRSLGALD